MFVHYALKTFFRKLLSSALLTLLLAATSVLLCLSLGLSYAADIICGNLDSFYTTLAIIQPGPQREDYPAFGPNEYYNDAAAYAKMLEEIVADTTFENVSKIDRRFTLLGCMEDVKTVTLGMSTGEYFLNGDFDRPNNLAVLVVKKTAEKTENTKMGGYFSASYEVTDVITAHETYTAVGSVNLQMTGLRAMTEDDLPVGQKYLILAFFDERSLNTESMFPEDYVWVYSEGEAYFKQGDETTVYADLDVSGGMKNGEFFRTFSGTIPIMTRLDTDLESFWQTDIGKEWLETTIPYVEKHIRALQVTATDDVKTIQYFNTGKARLEEGRYITASEYEQGAAVCMVSAALAKENGWTLGDQLSMQLYNPEAKRTTGIVATSHTITDYHLRYDSEVREEQTYTIVGLYQTEGAVVDDEYYISPNTVFVPKSSLSEGYPASEAPVANRLSIVIANNKLDAFKAEAEELGYGDFFLYNDQGYSAIADTLRSIRESAGSILNMSLGLWVFSLLLVVFLFLLMQRKYAATMWQLGCKKGNIFVYILTQLGVLSIFSAVLAFVGSNALYEKVVTWMISGNISQFDDAFSALSTSGGTVEEVMGYLTQSPETFLKIVGVQMVAFVVVFAVSALAFSFAEHRAKK